MGDVCDTDAEMGGVTTAAGAPNGGMGRTGGVGSAAVADVAGVAWTICVGDGIAVEVEDAPVLRIPPSWVSSVAGEVAGERAPGVTPGVGPAFPGAVASGIGRSRFTLGGGTVPLEGAGGVVVVLGWGVPAGTVEVETELGIGEVVEEIDASGVGADGDGEDDPRLLGGGGTEGVMPVGAGIPLVADGGLGPEESSASGVGNGLNGVETFGSLGAGGTVEEVGGGGEGAGGTAGVVSTAGCGSPLSSVAVERVSLGPVKGSPLVSDRDSGGVSEPVASGRPEDAGGDPGMDAGGELGALASGGNGLV